MAELMENLGAQYLRNNLWVPISGTREEVVILISDPSNYQRIMEIQGILNARNYVFRVGLPEHILQYLGNSGTGYRGRTGVHELLRGTHAMQSLIYNHAPLEKVREQAIADGMTTLKQDGIVKIFKGFSDYQQLLRVAAQ